MSRPPKGITHSVTFICYQCDSLFVAFESHRSRPKTFCSRKCYGVYRSENVTLSQKHYARLCINHLGENNPNWKGGKEHNLEVARKWRREHKDSVNQRNANRRALLRNALGEISLNDWILLKENCNFTCPMCGRSEPVISLTRDHIIPLSRGGHNIIANLQPLCLSCNSSKKDRVIPSADGVDIEL